MHFLSGDIVEPPILVEGNHSKLPITFDQLVEVLVVQLFLLMQIKNESGQFAFWRSMLDPEMVLGFCVRFPHP